MSKRKENCFADEVLKQLIQNLYPEAITLLKLLKAKENDREAILKRKAFFAKELSVSRVTADKYFAQLVVIGAVEDMVLTEVGERLLQLIIESE